MRNIAKESASILFIGMGWFPTISGGLNRYVYELIHQLNKTGDLVELCGVDLPISESNCPIKLTNFASSDKLLWQRLLTAWVNFSKRQILK
ncbi:MAG: glycosyltransferase family 1 protein, partial [Snowella sp.]